MSRRTDAGGSLARSRRKLLRDAVVGGAGLTAVGVWAASRFGDRSTAGAVVDLRDASPDPDDASPAFARALAELSRSGGGVLWVPPGTWRLAEALDLRTPDVAVIGAGLRATRLEQDGANGEAVVRILADGVRLERLTVRGSLDRFRPGDGAGLPHGIRVGEGARDVHLRDVVVEDAAGYGIGFEPAGGRERRLGLFDGFVLENVSIVRCGQDGIDIKNYDSTEPTCPTASHEDRPATPATCNGSRSFLRHIAIEGHSALAADAERKSGIDVRGQRQLELVEVLDVRPGGIGVHLRIDPGGYPNGRGAQGSTIQNLHVAFAPRAPDSQRPLAVANPDVPGCAVVAVGEHQLP